MSMLSDAFIAGGAFNQNLNVHRQVYVNSVTQTQKGALDRLQEAVAYKAFHNSGGRYDRPKCHPHTRVAVRTEIEEWVTRIHPDTRNAPVLWLSGAAGAGKSTIAQTVAEDFHSKGLLVASFFFERSDATRNHAQSLVATIAYQLYAILPQSEQSLVLAVIDRDPLIFTKSLFAQFDALIVNPLQRLFSNGFWNSTNTPRLVVIDGLDECLDHGMQRDVLLILCASVREFRLPFMFLLVSRPEHDIQAVFGSPDFLSIHTRLFLDDTYLPDRDVKLFLRDQFQECRTTHPFRHMISSHWPSEDILDELVRKSSGQFIYASVVAKYVKSSRHRPDHRLDVILNLRPASRELPFSDLDVLYTHIFSGVYDIKRVLDVLSFHIISRSVWFRIHEIECILRLDPGEVVILFCDLSSVIGFENDSQGRLQLKLLHASLVDYLLDSARSKEYFIDVFERCTCHVTHCFQFLSYVDCEHPLDFTAARAMSCFAHNHLSLRLTEPLYLAMREFSIPRMYYSLIRIQNSTKKIASSGIFQNLTFEFLPALFKFLQQSDSAEYLELHQHHQSEYDLFLRESLKSSSSKTPIPLFFTLIAIYRKIPIATLDHQFCLFDSSHFEQQTLVIFQPRSIKTFYYQGYVEYLSNFLWDRKRSREYYAEPNLFALAAKFSLSYLCNHESSAQKVPPRISAAQRMRRTRTPWKWHRRTVKEDIGGPRDTPWLWLRQSTTPSFRSATNLSSGLVYLRKVKALNRIHGHFSLPSAVYDHDPVVKYRVNSEKYYLALTYLNYFLPRAAKLDELLHMCQTLTFASLSQNFPRKSARARSNMHKYATQWG